MTVPSFMNYCIHIIFFFTVYLYKLDLNPLFQVWPVVISNPPKNYFNIVHLFWGVCEKINFKNLSDWFLLLFRWRKPDLIISPLKLSQIEYIISLLRYFYLKLYPRMSSVDLHFKLDNYSDQLCIWRIWTSLFVIYVGKKTNQFWVLMSETCSKKSMERTAYIFIVMKF